jgi:hypothetical protein
VKKSLLTRRSFAAQHPVHLVIPSSCHLVIFQQAVYFLLHFPYPCRTVGVTHHRVLWSPDFPLPGRPAEVPKQPPAASRAATVRPACRLPHYSRTFGRRFWFEHSLAIGPCFSRAERYINSLGGASALRDSPGVLAGLTQPRQLENIENYFFRPRSFDPDGHGCYDGRFRLCVRGLAFGLGS